MQELDRSSSPAGSPGASERDHLDHAVLDEHREALGAVGAELVHGPGSVRTIPEPWRSPVGVREELDVGPGDALVLGPASMTCPSFTQNTSTSSIPAALRASCPAKPGPGTWIRWGEGAGKAHDEGLLAREARGACSPPGEGRGPSAGPRRGTCRQRQPSCFLCRLSCGWEKWTRVRSRARAMKRVEDANSNIPIAGTCPFGLPSVRRN